MHKLRKTKLGEIWKPTKYTEIQAYIGLVIEAGIRKNGITAYTEFWDPLYGDLFFRDFMSKNRYRIL